MANTQITMPMVEAVAPDGTIEFWLVATAHDQAVATVQNQLGKGYKVSPTSRRLPASMRVPGLRNGEARRVGL